MLKAVELAEYAIAIPPYEPPLMAFASDVDRASMFEIYGSGPSPQPSKSELRSSA